MAEFFAERGIKKAACFTAQSANATTYGNSFINSFNNLGGSVVSKMDYSEDHIDFKIHITNSIQNGAEAFYLAITTGKDGGFITSYSLKSLDVAISNSGCHIIAL